MIKQFFKAVVDKFGCDECHNKELLMAVLESNKQQIERLNNIMSALTNLQEALNRLTAATDNAVTVLNTPHPTEEALQAAADLVNSQAARLEAASDNSAAHELVHHQQNQNKKLNQNVKDIGGPIEDEANAVAGQLIKKFGYAHPKLDVFNL